MVSPPLDMGRVPPGSARPPTEGVTDPLRTYGTCHGIDPRIRRRFLSVTSGGRYQKSHTEPEQESGYKVI